MHSLGPAPRRIAVVGAGPNGLAAAVVLARAGLDVDVLERNTWVGGGAATRELTLTGFRHDVASAVHPMTLVSPFFQAFNLAERIALIVPEVSFAHPLPNGRSGLAYRDLDRTADALGADGPAYRALVRPLVERLRGVADLALDSLLTSLLNAPKDPVPGAIFAARVAEQGSRLWNRRFTADVAPALLTGAAAHTIGRHPSFATAAGGLLLSATAHAGGWPVPRGGSAAITDALVADLEAHGGRVHTGVPVRALDELGDYDASVLDVSVPALTQLAGEALPTAYARTLRRFRPGCGVSKVDFALSEPIGWADVRLAQAPTLHLGGTRAQIAHAEAQVMAGGIPESPYVLAVQPSVIDPTRAPAGRAVLWAYVHVPYGSEFDATETIIRTITEYAPGFRDVILASHATRASDFGRDVSPNFAGGDFASGAVSLRQLARRPVLSRSPWRTPLPGVYLASGAVAPGPSVHGMGGFHAARTLLADHHIPLPSLA